MGKESLFPIDAEADRAKKEGAEAKEVRLLLDPCRDRPEDLLDFGDKGELKAQAVDALKRRVVKESAAVYGLNRSMLAQSRGNLALEVGELLNSLKKAAGAVKKEKNEANRRQLADLLRNFLRRRQDQAPHAGLVRQKTPA